jgi:hypothetical protein
MGMLAVSEVHTILMEIFESSLASAAQKPQQFERSRFLREVVATKMSLIRDDFETLERPND